MERFKKLVYEIKNKVNKKKLKKIMSSENKFKMPNSLNEHWMPFTSNKDFKENPRLIAVSYTHLTLPTTPYV